jgi:nucleotide-binding universal stress UspA family protein
MKILICVACESGAGPQLSFGRIFGSVGQSAALTLLHVLPRGGDQAIAERCLSEARDKLQGCTVEARIRHGDPSREILTELEKGDFDLGVLGPNDAPGLKRHLLGSVTSQVVRRAPSSVLVAQQARSSIGRLLICSGGADVAETVIETGAWISEAVGAQATLLHVVTPVPSMYTGFDELEESLSELLQTDTPIARHLRRGARILKERNVSAELMLRYGVVADEIIREAREGNNDLVLLGASKGRAQLKRLMLGEVTEQVVQRSSRSVLVVRKSLGKRREAPSPGDGC